MEGYRMCPAESCERYRKATRLMGGCDCGEPLVPYLPENEPTTEDLAKLISAMSLMDPDAPNVSVEQARSVLDGNSRVRAQWLVKYGEWQLAIKRAA